MKNPKTPATSRESIFSKSMQVMRYVATRNRPITLKDLAKDLGILAPTGHRIIQELESNGWITWDRERCIFDVGPSLAGISATIHARYGVERAIRPLLKSVAEQCGETVSFHLYDRTAGQLIAYVIEESSEAVSVHINPGEVTQLAADAAGRAVMACLPDDEIERILSKHNLSLPKKQAIANATQLRKELRTIRNNGYAISQGERIQDVVGIAAPVLDAKGDIGGAVLISIPKFRFAAKAKLKFARQAIACTAHGNILLGPNAKAA